jgi:hypothetical protein
MKAFVALVTLGLLAGSAQAAELVVSTETAKGGGSVVAFDATSNGEVVGINFKLVVPGLNEKSVNLSRCVADLPKNWTGGCSALKGGIYVIAYSEDLKPMPPGVFSIGSVSFSALAKDGAKPTIDEFYVSGPQGENVASGARVE